MGKESIYDPSQDKFQKGFDTDILLGLWTLPTS
jgi:hypothetical protein